MHCPWTLLQDPDLRREMAIGQETSSHCFAAFSWPDNSCSAKHFALLNLGDTIYYKVSAA